MTRQHSANSKQRAIRLPNPKIHAGIYSGKGRRIKVSELI
jgi:hypothetical protein